MKICAFSDSHGIPLPNIKECELLFICGDIVPLEIQKNISKSLIWFNKEFIPWCRKQPVEHIYLIGGNHDFFLEKQPFIVRNMLNRTNITLLENSGDYYHDKSGKIWSIWGSPLCHIFYNWAFMYSDEYNKSKYMQMPDNLKILLTHDAAYEHNDQCLGFHNGDRYLHRGNIPLKEVIEQKKPEYHFYGHLHTCEHKLTDFNGTKSACVSLVNEEYFETYKPLYLEL